MKLNKEKLKNASFSERIKIRIVFGFLKFNTIAIRFFSFLFFRKNLPESPKKILIYRWGSIGDCICAMPAIYDIKKRYPNAILDIENNCPGASVSFMEQLLHPDFYRKVINSGNMSRSEYFKMLKTEEYDAYFMLLGSKYLLLPILKRMFFIRLAGIKYVFGQEANFVPFFRKAQSKYVDFQSVTENLKKALSELKIPVSKQNQYPLNIQKADEKFVNEQIDRNVENRVKSVNNNKKNIALSIGGSADYKKWPIKNYQIIANFLKPNFNLFIIGGKDDFEAASQLKNVINLCGKLTLIQSAVLMKNCLLTISNDTGPMHLSYAVGTPVIGLFSNWDFPKTWHPPEDNLNVALRAENIPCTVCLKEKCPYDNMCIKQIEVSEVKAEIELLLRKLSN